MIQVELIDSMGTDLSVVNAARVSFAKESEWEWEECDLGGMEELSYPRLSDRDERLIKFLARERHEIPFAHTAVTLRVNAPIFVARQAYKHKIGFVENEISRRYVDDEPKFYLPDVWRSRAEDKKQGSGDAHPRWNRGVGTGYVDYIVDHYENCLSLYQHMIADGVAPEQARMILPQSMMTEWVWTGSLLAYARFYNLRSKPDAQKEIQIIADKVGKIMSVLYPVSWNALCKGGTQ